MKADFKACIQNEGNDPGWYDLGSKIILGCALTIEACIGLIYLFIYLFFGLIDFHA